MFNYYFMPQQRPLLEIQKTDNKKSNKWYKKLSNQYGQYAVYQSVNILYEWIDEKKCAPYLQIICNILEHLDGAIDKHGKQKIFQILAFLCVRPKLIFKKSEYVKHLRFKKDAVNDARDSLFLSYKKEISSLYKKMEAYRRDYIIWDHYHRLGVKQALDKSRDSQIPLDCFQNLVKAIQDLYDFYYYQIRSLGISICHQPMVDEEYLNTCLACPYLIPLVHIILIRNAQWQIIMGNATGKGTRHGDYLLPQKADFYSKIERLDRGKKDALSYLSYKVCKKISNILAVNLKSVRVVNIQDAFHEDKIPFVEHILCEDSMGDLYYKRVYWNQGSYGHHSLKNFAVPNCDIDVLAPKLSVLNHLSPEQCQKLYSCLPDLLWRTKAIKRILSENDLPSTMEQTLAEYRALLRPGNYFLLEDIEGIQQKFAEKCKTLFNSNDRKSQHAMFKTISKEICLVDLTKIALSQSGAIITYYKDSKILPMFLENCLKHLKGELEIYPALINKLLKSEQTEQEIKILQKRDHKFVALVNKIRTTMTWERASEHLLNLVSILGEEKNAQTVRLIEIMKDWWKEPLGAWAEGDDSVKYAYYVAAKQTTTVAVHILTEKVVSTMIELSDCLAEVDTTEEIESFLSNLD